MAMDFVAYPPPSVPPFWGLNKGNESFQAHAQPKPSPTSDTSLFPPFPPFSFLLPSFSSDLRQIALTGKGQSGFFASLLPPSSSLLSTFHHFRDTRRKVSIHYGVHLAHFEINMEQLMQCMRACIIRRRRYACMALAVIAPPFGTGTSGR